MTGLGFIIDAGLFLSAGVGIKAAGPGVLTSYVIAGFVVAFVMQMLDGMATTYPTLGSFSTYAEVAFGSSAGFILGWLYWFILIMVFGAEITDASAIMSAWFDIPSWIPGLVCVIFSAVVNLANVRGSGESEFWSAFIKVAVAIAFLVIGILLFFGLLPGTSLVGMTHIAEPGFLPSGVFGIVASLLAVVFAFGDIEIVTIVAAEAEDPRHSIAAAIRSAIFRISVFYLDCMAAITLLLPCSQIDGADSVAESPFTQVLKQANVPGAVGFMGAIIILALLSTFNAQIYTTSRLVYSMSTHGEAPRFFVYTNEGAAPNRTAVMSMVFTFVSVGLQVVFDGSSVLVFLLNTVGGYLLVIWLIIALSGIKLQPRMEASNELSVRTQACPTLSWIAVVLIMGLAVGMFADPGVRQQVIAVVCVTAFLTVLTALTKKSRAAARKALEFSDGNQLMITDRRT